VRRTAPILAVRVVKGHAYQAPCQGRQRVDGRTYKLPGKPSYSVLHKRVFTWPS